METKICPCCQQRIRPKNPHHMDRAKVNLLQRIARLHKLGVGWVKVQRDGRLIPPEESLRTIQCDDVHALRLMWFGLLEHKSKRSGEYRITEEGRLFITGQIGVPKEILCKNGQVLERSADIVDIWEVKDIVLDKEYWNNYGTLPWLPQHQVA